MKVSKVKVYTDRIEADDQVQKSRATGWPAASVIENGQGEWIISAHQPHCNCGMCPVIHTNGYFESD